MAQISPTAEWGAEGTTSSKFPNDGSDWCGFDTANDFRVANRFDITSLPAAATVTQVGFSISVSTAPASGTATWSIGPYQGSGQGDPEADSAATMYSRNDVSADNYVSATSDFHSTGTHTYSDLGATAEADVEAARDAGTDFTMSIMEDGGDDPFTQFEEYTGTNKPTLTVTYGSNYYPVIHQYQRMMHG